MSVVKDSLESVVGAASFQDRGKLRAAMVAARDCPILPTSDVDPTPALGEESGDNLLPQQRLAVAALVGGRTFSEAARAAGCGRRTLFAWRQQPAFAAAVERTSREAIDVAVIRVRNLMLRATRVLAESMLDRPDAPSHAFRVLNSQRLWTIAERAADPAPSPDASAAPDVGPASVDA